MLRSVLLFICTGLILSCDSPAPALLDAESVPDTEVSATPDTQEPKDGQASDEVDSSQTSLDAENDNGPDVLADVASDTESDSSVDTSSPTDTGDVEDVEPRDTEKADTEAPDTAPEAETGPPVDPCADHICPPGPTPECDGDTAITYAANGLCTTENNVATCSWEMVQEVDCSLEGLICTDGACIFPESVFDNHAVLDDESAASSLQNTTVIDGNLLILDSELTGLALPHLHTVTGSVLIQNNSALVTVDLPALETVGGTLYIKDNTTLELVNLASLTTVGVQLTVFSNPVLSELDTSNLSGVGQSVTVVGNSALGSLGLPQLSQIGSDTLIHQNEVLADVILSELATLSGDLRISHNANLANIHAEKLASIEGSLRVESLPGLSLLQVPSLAAVGERISFQSLWALETLSLPALTTTLGDLILSDLAATEVLSLDQLSEVQGSLVVHKFKHLTTLTLPALESLQGSLALSSAPALINLHIPKILQLGGDLLLHGIGASSIQMSALAQIEGHFESVGNHQLLELQLSSLVTVGASLRVESCSLLETLEFPALQTVGGNLIMSGLESLATLSLPALTSTGQATAILANPGLTALHLPVLENIGPPSRWVNPPLLAGGLQLSAPGFIQEIMPLGPERLWTAVSQQYGALATITDLEELDASPLLDDTCTLGTTALHLEMYTENIEYVITLFEYTKLNNDQGLMVTLVPPPGGWQVGWNELTVAASAGNYPCVAGGGCTTICDTPWHDMNRLQLYRSGPKEDPEPVELGLRNVRFERYGDLPPTLAGKHLLIAGNPLLESLQLEALSTLHSLAILGNPSLPQCLLDLTLAAITLDAPSEIAENNTACTCTEEAPYTATCDEPPPPDSEGEEPPMP